MFVSLFFNFVHQFHKKAGASVHKKSGGVVFVPSEGPFSLDLLEAAPAFVHCWELGGNFIRGTD